MTGICLASKVNEGAQRPPALSSKSDDGGSDDGGSDSGSKEENDKDCQVNVDGDGSDEDDDESEVEDDGNWDGDDDEEEEDEEDEERPLNRSSRNGAKRDRGKNGASNRYGVQKDRSIDAASRIFGGIAAALNLDADSKESRNRRQRVSGREKVINRLVLVAFVVLVLVIWRDSASSSKRHSKRGAHASQLKSDQIIDAPGFFDPKAAHNIGSNPNEHMMPTGDGDGDGDGADKVGKHDESSSLPPMPESLTAVSKSVLPDTSSAVSKPSNDDFTYGFIQRDDDEFIYNKEHNDDDHTYDLADDAIANTNEGETEATPPQSSASNYNEETAAFLEKMLQTSEKEKKVSSSGLKGGIAGDGVPHPFYSQQPQQHPYVEEEDGADGISIIRDSYANSYYGWNHPYRQKPTSDEDGRDVPVFWRIPRSASETVENVMTYCYGLVLASAIGHSGGHEADADAPLGVIKAGAGGQYVNVDVSHPAGIQRAISMHLGSSDLVDAMSTPYIYQAADIFADIPERGKCFTMLRHPVERAVSLYHKYQVGGDLHNNAQTQIYKGLTIDEFADLAAGNNWMVRFLTGRHTGKLSWKDLEAAREAFGGKCLVGLVDRAEDSLRRYEKYFHWNERVSSTEIKEDCLRVFFDSGDKRGEHPTYEGTAAWETLRKKNEYDVLLYEYAKSLYDTQAPLFD